MDPIADLLTRIRNGYAAGKESVRAPYSTIKHELAALLAKHGYIETVEVSRIDERKKELVIQLAYRDKQPAARQIRRISKPGLRRYTGYRHAPWHGLGITVISTPQGLMTLIDARKQKLGGELICAVS